LPWRPTLRKSALRFAIFSVANWPKRSLPNGMTLRRGRSTRPQTNSISLDRHQ
jgi:hypothetical protein